MLVIELSIFLNSRSLKQTSFSSRQTSVLAIIKLIKGKFGSKNLPLTSLFIGVEKDLTFHTIRVIINAKMFHKHCKATPQISQPLRSDKHN